MGCFSLKGPGGQTAACGPGSCLLDFGTVPFPWFVVTSSLIEWLAFFVAVLLAVESWRWERMGRKDLERRARVCAAVVAFLLGLRLFVFEPFHGVGPSMLPTLPEHSVVLVDKSSFGLRLPGLSWRLLRSSPAHGDVVVASVPFQGEEENVLKRVVAIGGDEVRVEGERLFVNGQPVEAFEVSPSRGTSPSAWKAQLFGRDHLVFLKQNVQELSSEIVTWKVPEGHVFLAGDNRQVSYDSRSFGPIPEQKVLGKVFGVWKDGGFDAVDSGVFP